jgi:hypothetical protein
MGGLAGNSTHGAGFLEAALEQGAMPLMISCTSGQILWVYRFLCCRKTQGPNLGTMLQEDIAKVAAFHNPDLDLASLTLFGKPGFYRPAGEAYVLDAWHNAARSFRHIMNDKRQTFLGRRFLETFPCRLLIPDFGNDFFEDISQAFSEEEQIGIVFNSYSPADGHERVYLNKKARALLRETSHHPSHYKNGRESSYRRGGGLCSPRTIYQDITPEAVRDGLWLYQYGFSRRESYVDGAYFREIILSELTPAETIYLVRPMHYHWSGDLPRTWPEMEDLKTKVAFNGAYAGKRDQILLINKLLGQGELKSTDDAHPKYHRIDLVEMEMHKTRGFFGYIFEDMDVFRSAYEKSMPLLSEAVGEKKCASE